VSGVFQNIDPHPPLRPASVSSPRTKGVGVPYQWHQWGVHTRRAVRGRGVNILEDARHWIGLLQYNLSTGQGYEKRPIFRTESGALEKFWIVLSGIQHRMTYTRVKRGLVYIYPMYIC
jgi:hypothetical protein